LETLNVNIAEFLQTYYPVQTQTLSSF
jgi:hypothetical protein